MWITQDSIKYLDLILIQAKSALRFCKSVLGGKSHNRLLSIYSRKDRYTDIKLSTIYKDRDTTILWFSLFCNIHTTDDLDSGCDTRKNT